MKRFLAWLFWPKLRISGLSDVENMALIIINLLPIIGVLCFDWKVFPILLIYCIEVVIIYIFELSFIIATENFKQSTLMPTFILIILLAIVLLLVFSLPLTIVFLASDEQQTLQSITDYYFLIAIAVFVGNQLVIQLMNYRKYQKQKHIARYKPGITFIFKPVIILIIAIIIAKLGTYKIDLVGFIVFKTFLDMRSYLRKKDNNHYQYEFATKTRK